MSNAAVLFVDDEVNVLHSLKRVFRSEGYDLLTACSGQEGLDILENTYPHVVVSDQRMPGMTGTEFLKKVKEKYPNTVRVILSGYTEVPAILDAVNNCGIYRFLSKPWNDEQVKLVVKDCIRKFEEKMALENISNDNADAIEGYTHMATTLLSDIDHLSSTVLANLPVPVITMSDNGDISYVNPAAQIFFPEENEHSGDYRAQGFINVLSDFKDECDFDLLPVHCRLMYWQNMDFRVCLSAYDDGVVNNYVFVVDEFSTNFNDGMVTE